ncbi:toxin-antitoxin system YwqK family antitoxin [Polaribacter sp. Asnod6-C07]|uniref:toxin-antitoxin system YwqK family antitoxin n=1 Tax=Polaribacter sp. Asnod6-C07 TaxID=3160582 RepID=UPI0038685BAA
MLNIKRLGFVFVFLTCFFSSETIKAQKINQFDANKKRTGIWKKYHPNKRIRYTGQFINGKEVGVFKFYDITDSRNPTIIKTFSATSDSVAVSFYSINGVLKSKGIFIGKKRVGVWKYFFADGKLMSDEFYVDGKLDGKLVNYYPNGKPAEISIYKAGLKNGLSQKYTSKGILIEELMYQNNKPNGVAKYFELTGILKEKGVYKDGKRFGKWEFYLDGEMASDEDNKKKKTFTKTKKNK